MIKKLILILSFSLQISLNSQSSEEIIIFNSPKDLLNIGKKIYILEDKENKLSFEEILKPESQNLFQKSEYEIPNFNFTTSKIWVKFTVENKTFEKIYLELAQANMYYIDFYKQDDQGNFKLTTETGMKRGLESRELDNNFFFFELSGLQIPQTYYISILTESPMIFPLKIATSQKLFEDSSKYLLFFGMFSGILIVMFFYNLFIYFSVRDKIYLFYCAYLLIGLFAYNYISGNYGYKWNFISYIPEYLIFFTALANFFIVFFILNFLKIGKEILFYKISFYYLILNISFGFYNLITGHFILIVNPFQLITLLFNIYIFSYAILEFKKGNSNAKYILFGFSFYIFGVIIYILQNFTLLASNFLTSHAIVIGISLEVTLFSFALANRIKKIQIENEILSLKKKSSDDLNLLRKLIDSSTDAIQASDEDGNFVYMNNIAIERLGIEANKVESLKVKDIEAVFADEASWKAHVEEVKQLGVFVIESQNTNKTTGKIFPVEVSVKNIIIDGKGYMVAISREITERKKVEQELKDSKELFSSIINNIGGIAYRCQYDDKFTMHFISEEVKRMTGHPPEDFILNKKISFAELIHPEDRNELDNEVFAAIKDNREYELNYRLKKTDSIYIWVTERGQAVFDETGKPKWLDGVIMDMSSVKDAEKEILKQRQNLIQVGEIAKVGGWEFDLKQNKISWDKIIYDIHELPYNFIPTVESVINFYKEGESRDKINEAIGKAIQTGEEYNLELELVSHTGKEIWVRALGFSEFENNVCTKLFGVFQDITEQKLIQIELRKYFAENISITEALNQSAIVSVTDIKGNIIKANPIFCEISGYSESELIGQNHRILNSKYHPPEFWKEMWKTVSKGKAWRAEVCNQAKNGELYWVDTIINPMYDASAKIYQYLSIRTLVTERKKAEKELKIAKENAESASKTKSEFLANMSHEIRTPLNGVIGFTELLKNTNLSEVQKQYLESANVSGHTLLGIINDILDFSKIEAGMMELEIIKIDLIELLENSIDIVKFTADKKNLELLLNIDPNLPRFALTDPIRLKQVLANLLSNAVKFTEKGEVELKIKYSKNENGKDKLSFFVRDTGIGISEEQQKKLFKAFSQADSSTTRKYGGTGLGLIISDLITEKLGGKIQIESEKGNGTTFYFDLFTETEDGEKLDKSFIKNINNCLIIDDNLNNRIILNDMLLKFGVNSELFDSGKKALERLQMENNFDVIICDYNMPEMDGLETIRLIKEKLLIKNKQPIILLHSSSVDSKLFNECDELGIRFMLNKPVKSADLFSYLTQAYEPKEKINFTSIEKQDINNDEDQESNFNIKILVVDDVELNLKLIKAILKKNFKTAEIFEARNGIEAMNVYQEKNPILILMDIQMPEMDGLTATREIRKLEEITKKHIPIIALTAGAFKEEQERCFQAGMDDFLTKPVDAIKLKNVISKFIMN